MLNDVFHRLRSLFRRTQVETELDEELLFHFERHVERGIRSGLDPQEAHRQARLAFGATESVKDECRDARGVSHIESMVADIRYALRLIGKSPVFASVIICSLAIGIGANTAIYTLMDAMLWRNLPIQNPEGLSLIGTQYSDGVFYGVSYRDYRSIVENSSFFSGVAAYGTTSVSVSIDGNIEPASPEAQLVTGGYFRLLGVNAALGRTLGPEDDRLPGGHPVAMISHGYWERRFASDPAIVGRSIVLCGTPFTIVGVTPREFFGIEVGKAPDLFAPAMMQPALMPASENWLSVHSNQAAWLRPIVRMNAGLTVAQVQSQLDFRYKLNRPTSFKEPPQDQWKLVLTPATNGISELRQQFSQPLIVLMAMVGALLLLACANVANMLMARAAARAPEFAMRLALGAGRPRLIQQLLIESLLLAGCGGLLGLAVAYQSTQLLVTFMSSGRAPIVLNLAPDWRILVFTAAVSIITGLAFGLVPALRLSAADSSLRIGGVVGKSSESQDALRPGRVLVVLQMALCVVLLAAATLFGQSLRKLNARDDGFARETVLTMRLEPRGSDQRGISGTEARLNQLYRALLDDVSSIPGVRAASLARFAPTYAVDYTEMLELDTGKQMRVPRHMVYPGYFETMGMPVAAGRDLGPADLDANSPCVVIVNETLARRTLGDPNPVGRTFRQSAGRRGGTVQCEIVGVVKDSKYANLRGEALPVIFQSFLQTNTGRGQMILHVRIDAPSRAVVPRLREAVQKTDPSMPLFDVRSLAQEMDAALVRERVIATLSGFFGVVALALACVGLYGLISFAVIRRTREFGIRMALGATAGNVAGRVTREVALLLGFGLALGIPAAFAAGRVASSQISGLLFGLTSTDPLSLLAAAAILAVVAGCAGFLPARRASLVDPVIALRSE